MRNRFNGMRRGRRSDRSGSAPIISSPYDFGSGDDERVDPVDLMAIRADDELLDALASGDVSFGDVGTGDGDLDAGFHDDRQMLAMLAAWRDDVRDAPVAELVDVEQASEAIVAGQRAAYPRRRLAPVAAAAALVVLGLSGVAIGAGSAEPGDALWGVSKTLDGDRAESVEAAQRVSVALASVQQALAEGKVSEAQVKLASIAPELAKVTETETKDELARKQANLLDAVSDAEEGEKVRTDEAGKRDDGGSKSGGSSDKSLKSSDAKSSDSADSRTQSSSTSPPSTVDPRRSAVAGPAKVPPPTTSAAKPAPTGPPPAKPDPAKPDPAKPDPRKPDPTKPDPTKPDPTKPDPTKPDPPKDDPTKPESTKPDPTKENTGGEGARETSTPPPPPPK